MLQAAFWYGLVVHFRIYPIIYALPILLILNQNVFKSGLNPALQNWSKGDEKAPQSNLPSRLAHIFNPLFLLRSIMTKENHFWPNFLFDFHLFHCTVLLSIWLGIPAQSTTLSSYTYWPMAQFLNIFLSPNMRWECSFKFPPRFVFHKSAKDPSMI